MARPAGAPLVSPVLLTRTPADNAVLARLLTARGVEVRELPCLRVEPVPDPRLPREHAAVAFGSRRGAQALAPHLGRLLDGVLVGAVGPTTARALTALGHPPDLVADPPVGEVLAGLLADRLPPGGRVVAVRGDLRGGSLEPALAALGVPVEPLVAYRHLDPEVPALAPFPVAGALVASPSAGRRLLAANPWLAGVPLLTLGPTTARALTELGATDVRVVPVDVASQATALASLALESSP